MNPASNISASPAATTAATTRMFTLLPATSVIRPASAPATTITTMPLK